MWPGVLVGFVSALTVKYPDIPLKATEIFIKTRLFIKIKSANKKLAKIRLETRQKISERQFLRMQQNAIPIVGQGADEKELYSENYDNLSSPLNYESAYANELLEYED
jgi:hypothetical protein